MPRDGVREARGDCRIIPQSARHRLPGNEAVLQTVRREEQIRPVERPRRVGPGLQEHIDDDDRRVDLLDDPTAALVDGDEVGTVPGDEGAPHHPVQAGRAAQARRVPDRVDRDVPELGGLLERRAVEGVEGDLLLCLTGYPRHGVGDRGEGGEMDIDRRVGVIDQQGVGGRQLDVGLAAFRVGQEEHFWRRRRRRRRARQGGGGQEEDDGDKRRNQIQLDQRHLDRDDDHDNDAGTRRRIRISLRILSYRSHTQ